MAGIQSIENSAVQLEASQEFFNAVDQQSKLKTLAAQALTGIVLTGAAYGLLGSQAQAHEAAPERDLSDAPDIETTRARSVMTEKEKYCVDQALYSFESGRIGYGQPDRKGRFLKVRQHLEATALSKECAPLVDREMGTQQIMNGRPNTDYGIVSRSDLAVDKTINRRGFRAWKCFKSFSQRVFVTVTTADGLGDQKIYNGRKTKPNC